MIRFPNDTGPSVGGPDWCGIDAGQLHLWQIPLTDAPESLETLRSWLSETERRRAASFLLDCQAERYITCHAAVRQILGCYAELPPEAVHIEIRADGKPCLAGRHNGADLRFNLSHSGDLALLAVALNVEVGVDVEQLRCISSFDRMVQRCLERTERERVTACSPADRVHQFLRYWTHKEAYLKTYGLGLRRRLQDVVVDLQAPPYWRIVTHGQVCPGESAVSLVEVHPAEGFVGAVAWASGAEHNLSGFTWDGNWVGASPQYCTMNTCQETACQETRKGQR